MDPQNNALRIHLGLASLGQSWYNVLEKIGKDRFYEIQR